MGDYATLAEVQTRAPNLIKTSTFEDIITALLPAISRLIDRYMRREDDAYDASATHITATTIAFAATTPGTITDSGNDLAKFRTGQRIIISGSTSNDGVHTVSTGGVAGTIRTTDATVLEAAGASVTIETMRQFNGNGEEELFIDECVAVTAVEYLSAAATWTAWAATDYQELGHDGTPNTLPICSLYVGPYGNYGTWPEGRYNIRVTANWGWSAAIPELVKLACVEHAIYSFKQLQQGMQETGGLTELGMVELIPPLCKAALAMLDQMPKKAR